MDNQLTFDVPKYESPEQEAQAFAEWANDAEAQEHYRAAFERLTERMDAITASLADDRPQEGYHTTLERLKELVATSGATLTSLQAQDAHGDIGSILALTSAVSRACVESAFSTGELYVYRMFATFSDEERPFRCDSARYQPVATRHVREAVSVACSRLECFKKNGTMNMEKLARATGISKPTLYDLMDTPEKAKPDTADKLCAAVGGITYDELLGISEADRLKDGGPSNEYLLNVDVMEPEHVVELYMMADERTRRIVTMTLQKELMLQLCANRER